MEQNTNLYSPPDLWFQQSEYPLVFLAGPIQGTDNWQEKAATIFHNAAPDLNIANPRRKNFEKLSDEGYFIQVEWETYHLRLASVSGVIMFWCAKETEHDCSRSYAQTTRFELAEWITHLKYRKLHAPDRPLKLVIGIEPDYTGEKYIKQRLMGDLPEMKIHSTIEDTCKAVLNSFV